MAGNNSVQILRGSRTAIVQSDQKLLDGQLLYNATDNYLTVGGGASNDLTKLPIVCREIRGYAEDTSESKISANKNKTEYSITYDTTSGKLRYVENVTNNYYDNGSIVQNKEYTSSNVIDAEGRDSIILRYSSDEVDGTHFGNTNTGESAAVFGEANNNSANRALLAGKLNNNSGANAIVGGLRNTVKANHGITSGSVNTVEVTAIRSVTAGYNNTNSGEDSIQTGTSNENYGIGSAEFGSLNINRGHYSALIGSQNINRGNYSALIGACLRNEQQNEDGTYNTKVIVGKWNEDKLENVFEVGNGTSNAERSNAFEVLRDGRAKVYGNLTLESEPTEDRHVATIKWIEDRLSTIDSYFFNSLY